MFTVVVTKKNTRRILTVIVLILLVIIGFTVYGSVKRRLYAVKGGVTVEGQDFSGLFRQEAYEKLEEMAGTFYKSPSDAFYLSETGEIISENYGIQVNVMETLDAVMSASKGEEIKLSVSTVAPSVTSDMMKPIYSVNTDRKAVAIGINVAWGEDYLPGILEELEKRHINCTFFITGTWGKQFPDMVNRIDQGGHELANHGYGHPHVENMNESGLVDLIKTNEKLIKEITGFTTNLFTPPYGEVNERISSIAGKQGYRTTMWTIDTIDWKLPEPDVIVQRVMGKLVPGAIILAHPTEPTLKALPTLLNQLKSQGYEVMTISELLALENDV